MIDTKQLMRGNWVSYDETNTPGQVLAIMADGIDVEFEGGEMTWIEADQFSPIELTPDVLLQAGFNWNSTNTIVSEYHSEPIVEHIYGYKDKAGVEYRPEAFAKFLIGNIQVKYLHELQNAMLLLYRETITVDFGRTAYKTLEKAHKELKEAIGDISRYPGELITKSKLDRVINAEEDFKKAQQTFDKLNSKQ